MFALYSADACISEFIPDEEILTASTDEDEKLFAFQDIDPTAPTHILVIPKKHIRSINELEITDALQMMLEEDNIVNFEMITDYWKDTGTPDDIIHANGEVLKNMKPYFFGTKENDTKLSGNIMIGKNTRFTENETEKGNTWR